MDALTLARCTGANLANARRFAESLTDAMQRYDIDTPVRQAMFLANVGHESGRLQFTTEIWGPTPAQRGYEGRANLGNTRPGDGPMFRGHGLLQTTGRANHAAVRDRLRARFPDLQVPDFEIAPQALALPAWAALSAADYVDMRRLNVKADAGDFLGYCVGINGKNKKTGRPNGWAERVDIYDAARQALGIA